MNRIIFVFFCLQFLIPSLFAQITNKNGHISDNEEWADTIKIDGDVVISGNGKVVIKPGALVEFQGDYKITVKESGSINAIGEIADSVYFTTSDAESDWNGIRFNHMQESADTSRFSFCKFSKSVTDEHKVGGAITVHNFSNIIIRNSVFANNTAEPINFGGAIHGYSADIKIIDCSFSKNYSSKGGALYFIKSSPIIRKCSFLRNRAYHAASAIYLDSCHTSVIDCIFYKNSVNSSGGEVISIKESTGKIQNVDIRNNYNRGIYCYLSDIEIINALVANNSGSGVGGIQIQSCSPTLINSTIVNNFGYKVGGVFNSYSDPNIINCIIWGNSGSSNELLIEGNYLPFILNSDLRDGEELNLPSDRYLNNIDEYPSFVNPSPEIGPDDGALLADWSLLSCSPCINTGINDFLDEPVNYDLNKEPRIFDQIVDIGAYESREKKSSKSGKRIIYVSNDGKGNGDSWDDSMGNLQEAINSPLNCFSKIEIWVKGGVYYPDTTGLEDPRLTNFYLRNNIAVYGGFSGNETSINQRDIEKNETILSGDIGEKNNNEDNSYHVVVATNVNSSCLLDGVTISNGMAGRNTLGIEYERGAGLYIRYGSLVIENCKILNNKAGYGGGGVHAYYSNPLFSRTLIANNESLHSGGGVSLDYSDATFLSSKIINNRLLNNFSGGGFFMRYSDPKIINSIITNNESGPYGDGGGIYCAVSSPKILNSVIANNYSHGLGAGIYFSSSPNATIINTILWDNQKADGLNHISVQNSGGVKIENCIVQEGNSFGIPANKYINNIDKSPRFVRAPSGYGYSNDALDADWDVFRCSPAIDNGTSDADNIPEYDIVKNPRINNSIDIGPYESELPAINVSDEKKIVYLKSGANGDGSSWENAAGNIQDAINSSLGCYSSKEVWVAAGTYLPNSEGLDDKRLATIELRNNTAVYGGFNGSEIVKEERDWETNMTVVSGNIGEQSTLTDNSYNVVVCKNLNESSIFDGFCIRDGYADGAFRYAKGGGIYCFNSTNILSNLKVVDNYANDYGGGIYISDSEMKLTGITIENNFSGAFGGGIRYDNSILSLINSKFINNKAEYSGGAIASQKSKSDIVNCIMANNTSDEAAAFAGYYSNSAIINSTIVNNRAYFDNPGGIFISGALTLENSIIWGNTNNVSESQAVFEDVNRVKINNSTIQGGNLYDIDSLNYANNLDTLPGFKEAITDVGTTDNSEYADWSLSSCSPCINKGVNNRVLEFSPFDIEENSRIFNDTVDIGAYEVQDKARNAPTDIILSNNTIYKHAPQFTSIGKLSAVDNDLDDSFSFSIVDGDYFSIIIDSLVNSISFSQAWRTDFPVSIQVTDKYNCSFVKNFKIKVDSIDISVPDTEIEPKFSLFPNPVKDKLYIENRFYTDPEVNVEIYSIEGKLIKRTSLFSGNRQLIPISNLQKGIYIVVISLKNNPLTEIKKIEVIE